MDLSDKIDRIIREKRYRLVNSVIICQGGEMVAENYYNGFHENSRNVLRSVMKSILSAVAGIAVQKGKIDSLDTPVAEYLPVFREGRDMLHPIITVRHLLTMTSGIYWNGGVHYHCPMMVQLRRSKNWVSYVADCPVTDVPGTRWNYKEFGMILLAAVLQTACGDLYDFLDRELYQPLGIQSGRWFQSPDGVYYSVADTEANEAPSNLTARELLAIGQMYRDNGVFGGTRILSEEFVKETTRPYLVKDYGYLWWCGTDWFSARGFGGQRITVFPEKDVVAVVQATPTPQRKACDDLVFGVLDGFDGSG